jgi:hypothetical protein
MAVQVPLAAAVSQAAHCPAQATLQQTPSAQNPVPHCEPAEQTAPGVPLGMQTPAEHQSPAWQPASVVQVPAQAVGPQR